MTPLEVIQLLITDTVWSGIAALGFAVLFNTPKRLLVSCFLVGALGHPLRTVLVTMGTSIELGTLVGAIVVGFFSVYLADRFRVPASSFTVVGAIPMVPGVFAYQTIISLLEATAAVPDQTMALLAAASINGIRTALILSTIAFGIAAPALLFRRQNAAW